MYLDQLPLNYVDYETVETILCVLAIDMQSTTTELLRLYCC